MITRLVGTCAGKDEVVLHKPNHYLLRYLKGSGRFTQRVELCFGALCWILTVVAAKTEEKCSACQFAVLLTLFW